MVWRKIIRKVLFSPVVKRRFEKVNQLYEAARIEKERGMFSGKHEVYPLNFTHYLPDTEERIERLRRVINKRPVAIILLGSSAAELEERITELDDCDICYCALNASRPIEKYILQKINRKLSVFMYSAIRTGVDSHMDETIEFLERPEDNIFIGARSSFRPLEREEGFDFDEFIKKYDKKLLFFEATFTSIIAKKELFLRVPSIEYPLHFPRINSFAMLLSLVVIGGAPMVVVFGGDGGRINGRELYFRKEWDTIRPESVLETNMRIDARLFNVMMPLELRKIYKLYNLRPVDIINCSVQSHYTPLRKLSYDETFALLKSFKEHGGQSEGMISDISTDTYQ